MTTEYLLKQIIITGTEMRAAQKSFFALKHSNNFLGRAEVLAKSKQLELKFDLLLKEADKVLNP